jgi:hypothetical protein
MPDVREEVAPGVTHLGRRLEGHHPVEAAEEEDGRDEQSLAHGPLA